jgi:SAM-dependent methyltransferase
MASSLTPGRRRGVEILDEASIDARDRERAHRDIERANLLFGGRRAMLLILRPTFDELLVPASARSPTTRPSVASTQPCATLVDVGTGLADIPWRARELARRRGLRLRTIGLDSAHILAAAARHRLDDVLCANALDLPFPDHSVDVVLCSQLLHHFEWDDGVRLIAELHRVARRRVVIGDLRRSWVAAAGFWLASVALRFHPITRHDGTTSVLRGFTEDELGGMVVAATGRQPAIRRRLGFRLTATWTPCPMADER